LTKTGSEIAITIQRPDPYKLAGAGVNQISLAIFALAGKMFARGKSNPRLQP